MNNILRNCRSLINSNYNYLLFKDENIIFKRNYGIQIKKFSDTKCSNLTFPHDFIAAVRKRFYRKTGILYNDGKYEVTLDQRKLKTPNGNLFTVESEPLALAVAAEWDAQKERIQQSSMYLVKRNKCLYFSNMQS